MRSRRIYVVLDFTYPRAAFTVKHEAVTWLRQWDLHTPDDWTVWTYNCDTNDWTYTRCPVWLRDNDK